MNGGLRDTCARPEDARSGGPQRGQHGVRWRDVEKLAEFKSVFRPESEPAQPSFVPWL